MTSISQTGQWIVIIIIVMVIFPVLTYFTVKMATYAYLRAKDLYEQDISKESKNPHGDPNDGK